MRAKIHFQAGRSRNSRRGLAAVGIMLGVALTLGLPTAGGRTLPVPFANDYLAENWGLDEGFPENSCSGIVTAPDGAMWMGTFRGLVRFNGQKFSSWAPAALPELKSVTIYNLFRDKRGRIWISTAEGLTMCDQGVWRRWQENDGWGNRAVFARSYAEAPDGTLVIARSTGRVMQLEAGGVWRELPVPAGTGGTMCAFDDTGALYAVRSGAAGMLDGGAWRAIAGEPTLVKQAVGAGQDRAGRAVIVTQHELLRLRQGRVVERAPLSLPVQIFWQLAEDTAGALWASGVGSGVYRIRPDGTVRHLLTADGLPTSGPTRVVYPDERGAVWIGSGVGGLARLRPREFRHLGEAEGLGDREILTLAPLPDGRVLLTTYGTGLAYFDGEKSAKPFEVGKLGSARIRSVLRRRDGSLWFGTAGKGLLRLDGAELTPVSSGIFGPAETISTLFEDARGRLWIGGENRAANLDQAGFHPVDLPGPPERVSPTFFAEQRDGTVLLARHNEVFAHGPAGLRADPLLRLPETVRASCLLVDRDDRVWLGTAGHGLFALSGGEHQGLSVERGLPGDAISALIQDDAGRLWFGSNRQVVRADPAELWRVARTPDARPVIDIFDQSDGLRDLDFPVASQPTVAKDAHGRLWFALVRGAAMVDPATLNQHPRSPPVLVESLSFVPAGATRPVEVALGAGTASPALPAGSRLIRISYTALDFLAFRKQRFRVRLGGSAGQWQYMGSETAVNFVELPPGRHTLQVQTSGGDAIWDEPGATLAFTLAPYYWQTSWFRALVSTSLAGLVGAGAWFAAQRRVRAEREKLERDRRLAEAQARLALVLENTSDFVAFADPAGQVLYVNRAGRALTGLGPEDDLRALPALQLLAERTRDEFAGVALGAAVRDGTWSGESALRHRDGHEIPVSLALHAHRSPAGTLDFTSVIARDISVAKRHSLAQEALRQLATKLSAAIEPTALGRAVAEACRELFGHDAFFFAPLDGRGGVELGTYSEDTREGDAAPRPFHPVARALSPVLQTVLDGEPMLINRPGAPDDPSLGALGPRGATERRSASLMFVPVRWEGKTIGLISVQSYRPHRYGPSELRQLQTLAAHCGAAVARMDAEASLRENEERLRLAMQSARLGSWEIAVESRQLFASPEAEAVYACTAGELSGPVENLARHVLPAEADSLLRQLDDLLASRTAVLDFTHRVALPDGTERWLEVKGRFLHPPGSPDQPRVIGVTADITDRRRAELARVKLEEQLRQSQKLEAVGTLAGGIAHDFNNILTAILGNTELAALDLPPGSPLRESLDEIRRSSHRARDLVKRLLAFSRPNENRRRLTASRPLVEEVVKLLRATIPASVSLTVRSGPDLPTVEADTSEIHQVLLNLGTNALHAIGGRPGEITFALEAVAVAPEALPHPDLRPGSYLRIAVGDDGCGIPRELLTRVFDPFFTTKAPGEGTGLGLSIAHGIMRSHGGAITVASTVGAGSVFSIYLPAARGDALTPAESPPPRLAAVPLGRGQRILYVDDEETIVALAVRMLAKGGFNPTGCTRPSEALALFRADPGSFAAAVTDFSMPEMNGLELAAELLRLRPDLPVVLASGHLRAADAEVAQRLGIRKILQKPQSLEFIVPTVAALLADAKS